MITEEWEKFMKKEKKFVDLIALDSWAWLSFPVSYQNIHETEKRMQKSPHHHKLRIILNILSISRRNCSYGVIARPKNPSD